MKIYIVGVGMGNPKLLTAQAAEAVAASNCLIGAQRMLDCFPESRARRIAAATPEKIAEAIFSQKELEPVAVLVSGDCGFYSAARGLSRPLECADVEYLPGISSLQYFCAKLRVSWDDVKPISLHAGEQDLLGAVTASEKTFVLSGGSRSAREICARLCENGFEDCAVHIGERLSYPDETITSGTAKALSSQKFDPLSVLLIQNAGALRRLPPVTHGIPDDCFLRGEVPMTKEEVRAVCIAKMRLRPGQTVWDIGAGTGSVSVEIARVLPGGVVYAVEKEADAIALLKQNQMKFGVPNLKIVQGMAPRALSDLPAPDAVFIGGSSGGISPVIDLVLQKNPEARIVANAITLETVGAVLDCFNRLALEHQEVVQLSVAKSKTVGGNHMMMGQNPIYILSAGGERR